MENKKEGFPRTFSFFKMAGTPKLAGRSLRINPLYPKTSFHRWLGKVLQYSKPVAEDLIRYYAMSIL
ncbi:TPA: hypothetical protein DIV45_01010 [Patescibacteria group bacterium]|nr:hypothetical protein [Patescibacteria group bacterium]